MDSKLPVELLENILLKTDNSKDLINLCKTNKTFLNICKKHKIKGHIAKLKLKEMELLWAENIKDDDAIKAFKLVTGKNKKPFLDWAKNKIRVIWSYGSLTNNENLSYFSPKPNETILTFLNRIVDFVNDEYSSNDEDSEFDDEGSDSDEIVFTLYDESLGKEYDQYQEESFSPKQLIKLWLKMQYEEVQDILFDEELQDILFDEEDFEKAKRFILKHGIDIQKWDFLMADAIGLENIKVAKFLIDNGFKMTKKFSKQLNRTNKEFQNDPIWKKI
jgi:hypothetical protein